MNLMLALITTLMAGLAIAAFLLIRKMGPSGTSLPLTAEWIDDLSIERYKPMLRLLDSGDIDFLRSQPGYTRAMEVKLRAQRCQVLRGYLRHLNTDFQRVCLVLKMVMVQSESDRPDLAATLIHHQVMFASGMLTVSFRLLLYRWGLCQVDVSSLVKIFDTMRIELRQMAPSAMPSCA